MGKSLGLTWTAFVVLSILSISMVACEQKTINQIMAEPDRYANKEVGISGTVARSYSVLGKGAYEVDDGTGKLWVVSDQGVPRTGSRVAVKGKIRDGFDLGSIVKLPDAISAGLVMIESSHRAR
jgi:membrane protein implicated in regulation of membrane protease activity